MAMTGLGQTHLKGGKKMKRVESEELEVGMGLKTWFGCHTILAIEKYTGPHIFIIGILVFSNGVKMSLEKDIIHDVLN